MAIFFSAVVAPAAFGVLRSFDLGNASEIAGTIVSRALSVVNKSGVLLSLLLLISMVAVRKFYRRTSFVLQSFLLIILGLSTAVGEWVIAAKMRGLRAAMNGHIDQVPLTDPNRTAFAALHSYSVTVFSIAMIAALVTILLMIASRERVVMTTTK